MPLAIGVVMLLICCLFPLLYACSAVDFAMQHAKEWKLCAQAREEEGEERREERRRNTGPGEQVMDGKEITVGTLAVGILSLIGSTVLIVLVVALRFLSIGTALPRAKIRHANSQLMANGVSKSMRRQCQPVRHCSRRS